MPIIESKLNPRSDDFRTNAAALEALVADLRAKIEKLALGGGQAARDKHTGRGKLLPRERIEKLLDPGTPFLEFSQLAAYGMYHNDAPGAGVITGIGRIAGQECVIVCNDATVKGGTYYPVTVKSTYGRRKSPPKIICRASTSSTRAVRICRIRMTCSRIAITSAASSLTRRICPRRVFRKSQS